MKSASLSQLRKELQTLPHEELVEICSRMARYKKENKELLNYLLFERSSEETYIKEAKAEVEALFEEVTSSNIYLVKKSIRKILKLVNKYIKYSGLPATTVELLIHFCRELDKSGLPYHRSTSMVNLYESQVKKIYKALSSLHEDLQYDYEKELLLLKVNHSRFR